MDNMKSLVYVAPLEMEVELREKPKPKAGEVLLKVKYAAICGSDFHAYLEASDRFRTPLILGHEFSAVVEELGEGVTSLEKGQAVCGNPPIYCEKCWYCKNGKYNICPNRLSLGNSAGIDKCDGVFTQYIVLPAFTLIPLPENVSLQDGALMEPLSVGLHAAKNGGFIPGETTVVIGTGPIGLMTIKSLKTIGAGKIICLDISKARLEMAGTCGADILINPTDIAPVEAVKSATDGLGAHRTIICTDVPECFNQAIQMTRGGGSVVLVGLIRSTIEFCPMDIFGRDINIISSYTFTDEIYEAVQLVSQGKIDLSGMITSEYPLERGTEAFEALRIPGNAEVKVLIRVNE